MNESTSGVAGLPQARSSRPDADAGEELDGLMGEYECSLVRFARSLLPDADLALDCVQDTFLRAYESLCRGGQVNRQWLFTVAHNRAVDELRHRRWLGPACEDISAPFDGWSETSLLVQEVMDALTRRHREVLYLSAVLGYTSDEIAALLWTSAPAVRERLYRARQEFRRAYGSVHGGCQTKL